MPLTLSWGEPPGVVGVYGAGLAMDSLGNTDMASGSQFQSYRFRAAATSTLASARVYIISGAGYSAGGTHTIRWTIRADDGTASHLPTGAALATQDVSTPNASDADHLVTFGSPASLTAGTLYHLQAQNMGDGPGTDVSTDYISLDGAFALSSPDQPRWPSPELSWLYGSNGTSWTERTDHRPIVGLTYGDATTQGQSYLEVSYDADEVLISGDNMGRERFTVSGGDKTVTGAGVRLFRLTGTDVVTVRLEQSDGTLIDSFTIPAASFNVIPDVAWGGGAGVVLGGVWVGQSFIIGSFGAPQTLTNGTTYNLRLSCAVTSEYHMNPLRSGETNYSYPTGNDAVFADGDGEFSTNAGSSWASAGRVGTNRNNLQVYLVTTA